MKTTVLFGFVLSALYLFCADVQGGSSPCAYSAEHLQALIRSASAALRFYERNMELLVPDAAVGCRILEAQLLRLLTHRRNSIPRPLRAKLEVLLIRTQAITKQVLDQMRSGLADASQAHLWKKLQTNMHWLMDLSLWNISKNNSPLPRVTNVGSSEMDEKTSDACIGSLFRTCKVSRRCSRIMIHNVTTEYSVTHQLLFMKIAKHRDCFGDINFRKAVNAKTPEEYVASLCSQVYKEFKRNVQTGYTVSRSAKDLALEQVNVCGLFGYNVFYKPQLIDDTISWQHSTAGCFYYDYEEIKDAVTSEELAHKVVVKREDKFGAVNKDEICSVHFTAVAVGAIGMFLGRIGDVCMF